MENTGNTPVTEYLMTGSLQEIIATTWLSPPRKIFLWGNKSCFKVNDCKCIMHLQ